MKSGQEEFNLFYEEIYQDRWPNLRLALMENEKQVKRWNHFATEKINQDTIPWLKLCSWQNSKEEIPRDSQNLLLYYVLDPASVLCAEALDVREGQKVLDLCAAPGGKSLILAQNLFAHTHIDSELILNELSANRRERLIKVIQQYVSKTIRPQVWVKGQDGSIFCMKHKNTFDRILLDAPCSGERHLLQNQTELHHWKKSRTKNLAIKQYSLLSASALALKENGKIVYSTCSISPLENDQVIEKFLNKKGENFEVLDITEEYSDVYKHPELNSRYQKCKFGIAFFPDQCGFGPLYFSLLQKKSTIE